MAKSTFRSVDEYLASQRAPVQRVLRRVRSTIRKALPGADETISYGIPTFKLDGRSVIHYAGWSEHYSLYPATSHLAEALGDELAPHETGKGTIRFALAEPVPVGLITRIAKLRAQEVATRAKAKATGGRKR
jgi:uncharacterized protein YdhG (YjbR/CyaY superfamily)